jgi:hypothetical protein
MKKILLTASLIMSIATSGCSTIPDSIKASTFDKSDYSSLSCDVLAQKSIATNDRLKDLSEQQLSKAKIDAISVALTFLPLGRMIGKNLKNDIADLKGEAAYIKAVQEKNNCLLK